MHRPLLSLAAAGLLVPSASAFLGHLPEIFFPEFPDIFPDAKNFIYIVPDGYGAASQTMARDFVSLLQNGEDTSNHVSIQLPADKMHIGTVQTFSGDNMITDSAASATAFACGFKTRNGAIGINEAGEPVGSILEAAHLAGMKTGLVVTTTISHATPAAYAAHSGNRNLEAEIAEQEIGFSHPLGSVVDILMGGGSCFFRPQSAEGSCRKDDKDLFGWAEKKGWNVFTDRAGFDKLDKGHKAKLPYVGLFNEKGLAYELDRDPAKEPSLVEMVETALNSLKKATQFKRKGYFLMIEASRIDHAGHAHDPAAHVHDVLQYNEVMGFVRKWVDRHPDTLMLSAADHETGGLTLNGYNPVPIKGATNSTEVLAPLFESYSGDDDAAFLVDTILPAYGITDATESEIEELVALKGKSAFSSRLGQLLSDRAGVHWSTGGHTAVDIVLHGYGKGHRGAELKKDMAGNWDNTQLPRYIEKALHLDMRRVTEKLRREGDDWVPGLTGLVERGEEEFHVHHS